MSYLKKKKKDSNIINISKWRDVSVLHAQNQSDSVTVFIFLQSDAINI